ncbi:hypothetical protein B0A49_01327 [Cryomyces minteri]|uniref:JmjC domain-containing protein n=1 Tax=Cryomyces minteri TaxID=331657 RepID=A0A4U0XVK9_9PEZI|nr:hypothetical protein B0A49_01327 [Cryomyces minteri]
MPAQRPRASFEPIPPDFDLKALVEKTPNFHYVDRISCDMIEAQGMEAFERLVLLHVIIGGEPLVVDGFEDKLDPWTFTPTWLRDNHGDKIEIARNLHSKDNMALTIAHYIKNMGKLANQYFDGPQIYKEKTRQRTYLKDIDCPPVWHDKLQEHIPPGLFYLNESTGEIGGPGAVNEPILGATGKRKGRGIARAGDLMSSLPPDMRAENMMCYIGHEGTYTPAHREMCASLGHNIMVETSGNTVDEDGKPERPGSSIWFMTESKDRHMVAEYWLSVLGHDIEVENHFAQVIAWKKAPFKTYVVEQRAGDFILIPPLAPHQVWNRGTRTMKVAWNRTTVETLEMALNEALPKARVVCRDEQYKNKAIVFYTLQKYSKLLILAQRESEKGAGYEAASALRHHPKVRQIQKDFKRLFSLYKHIILSEMFAPDTRHERCDFLPFDSNVTDILRHGTDEPYDVCMHCYAMGRSCGCQSNLKWVEQFKWKELVDKYAGWRNQIIDFEGGVNDKTPLTLPEERQSFSKKTLAQICQEQLKRRPWKDIHKVGNQEEDETEDEEIVVNENGVVKKTVKKRPKTWLKNHTSCHKPYEPKGTLLGHDTKKVADARSVECLVDFSMSNLNWLRETAEERPLESVRLRKHREEAEQAKQGDDKISDEHYVDDDETMADFSPDESRVHFEYSPDGDTLIDPQLGGQGARPQQHVDSQFIDPALRDYASASPPFGHLGPTFHNLPAPSAVMYHRNNASEDDGYIYLDHGDDRMDEDYQLSRDRTDEDYEPTRKRQRYSDSIDDDDQILLNPHPKKRKPNDDPNKTMLPPRSGATKQFLKEKERKVLEEAKKQGRFIAVSAALRGRKRLVKLRINGAKLAELIATQAVQGAAKAFGADGTGDASSNVLVQSDVVPPPTTTAASKPAVAKSKAFKVSRYRVEDDEDFDTRRKRNSGVDGKKKAKPVYEEVDIESEEDKEAQDAQENVVTSTSRSGNRRVPSYIACKHQDDADLPTELPKNWREGKANPHRERNRERERARLRRQTLLATKAEKRPDIRPARASTSAIPITIEDDKSDGSGSDDGPAEPVPAVPTAAGAESTIAPAALRPEVGNLAAKASEEENRKAKLQALKWAEEGFDPDSASTSNNSEAEVIGTAPREKPMFVAKAVPLPKSEPRNGTKPTPALRRSIFDRPGGKNIKIVSAATLAARRQTSNSTPKPSPTSTSNPTISTSVKKSTPQPNPSTTMSTSVLKPTLPTTTTAVTLTIPVAKKVVTHLSDDDGDVDSDDSIDEIPARAPAAVAGKGGVD